MATGKRKRPTGEAAFDIPVSPAFPDADVALNEVEEEPAKRPKVDEDADADADGDNVERATEEEAEPAGVLESMDANEGSNEDVNQKSKVKRRKKRKSIGQQATKKAKSKSNSKVSPIQPTRMDVVKPEPLSSPVQGEDTSRVDDFPVDTEDQAQIRQELQGAADEGMRDSLVGDVNQEKASKTTQKRKQKSIGQQLKKAGPTKNEPKGGQVAPEAHMYSLPASTFAFGHIVDSEAEHGSDDEEEQETEDEEPEQDMEEEASENPLFVPSGLAKTKRRKRKSIGQQTRKRTSAGASKLPVITKQAATTRKNTTNTTTNKAPPSESRPASSKPKSPTTKTRPAPANTIPITIYRPSPSVHSSSSSEDEDPLTAPLPPPTKTINAVDVLAQISRELIQKAASSTNISSRSQKTIQLYGRELEERMKQLGQALSTNAALGKRVRGLNGEDRQLKKALKEVESEQELVKEKMEEAKKLRDANRLVELLEGIGRVARRGWEMEREKATEPS